MNARWSRAAGGLGRIGVPGDQGVEDRAVPRGHPLQRRVAAGAAGAVEAQVVAQPVDELDEAPVAGVREQLQVEAAIEVKEGDKVVAARGVDAAVDERAQPGERGAVERAREPPDGRRLDQRAQLQRGVQVVRLRSTTRKPRLRTGWTIPRPASSSIASRTGVTDMPICRASAGAECSSPGRSRP